MFNKKYCKKCKEKINSKFNFCPNCGTPLYKKEDWGMLGKNDFTEDPKDVFSNMGGGMLGKMIGNTIKMLEKEMQKEMKDQNKIPTSNFKLMINGKEVKLNNNAQTKKQQVKKQKIIQTFPKKQLKKFSELPKQEAKTNLKRLGNKVVYEIEMPEVKNLEDIQIISLENSIEIKAVGKKTAYQKLIPFSMHISNQTLEKGKLILELKEN